LFLSSHGAPVVRTGAAAAVVCTPFSMRALLLCLAAALAFAVSEPLVGGVLTGHSAEELRGAPWYRLDRVFDVTRVSVDCDGAVRPAGRQFGRARPQPLSQRFELFTGRTPAAALAARNSGVRGCAA